MQGESRELGRSEFGRRDLPLHAGGILRVLFEPNGGKSPFDILSTISDKSSAEKRIKRQRRQEKFFEKLRSRPYNVRA